MNLLRVLGLVWIGLIVGAGCSMDAAEPVPDRGPESTAGAGEVDIVFNSDGLSLSYSIAQPVITPEQLGRALTELAETPVDVFAWCPELSGDSYSYPTQVAEIAYGDDVSEQEWARNHPRMRQQAENVRGFLANGHDPVQMLSRRARELGKQFWITLRMNDQHEDDTRRFSVKVSAFKRAHPDLLIGPDFYRGPHSFADQYNYTYGWNYAREEVRERRLAVIRELCTRYELDGFDLDFQRGPWYFKRNEISLGRPLMTQFMREVREMTRAVARQNGRPFTLSVRVPPSLDEADWKGLDVRTWIEEELVDLVTPMDEGYLDMNADVRGFVEAARGTRVKIAGGLERNTQAYGSDGHGRRARIEMMRAAAAGYYEEGAASVYLFNFDCQRQSRGSDSPSGLTYGDYTAEELQMLAELGDPERLAGQDKHYWITRDMWIRTPWQGGTKQLPNEVNRLVRSLPFYFTVGDDLETDRGRGKLEAVLLRVTVGTEGDLGGPERLVARLNDSALGKPRIEKEIFQSDSRDPSHGRPVSVLEFSDVPARRGRNELLISLAIDPEQALARRDSVKPVRIEKIELLIDYKEGP